MPTITTAKLALLALLLTTVGLAPAAAAGTPDTTTPAAAESTPGDPFNRTELYFGRNSPGGEITEERFQHFVDVEVTKRFPEGLTLIDALGQFQEESGGITKERSKVLILLYPLTDRQANREIEEIREAYKDQFQQFSVLRVDSRERVSF